MVSGINLVALSSGQREAGLVCAETRGFRHGTADRLGRMQSSGLTRVRTVVGACVEAPTAVLR